MATDYTVELTGKDLEEYLAKRFPAKPVGMIKPQRYAQNLRYTDNEVYSYNTLVAVIDHEAGEVKRVDWCVGGRTTSPTTSKHINYVASQLGFKVV